MGVGGAGRGAPRDVQAVLWGPCNTATRIEGHHRVNYLQRMAARMVLRSKLSELSGNEFEDFFQDLMAAAEGGSFLDVRTAGRLGDISADGFSVVDRVLYACYAPEVFDADNARTKLAKDIAGALAKRTGQFDTFCFVHNDIRGLHPLVSEDLNNANSEHAPLKFTQMGHRGLRLKLLSLSAEQAEDVLKTQLPVKDMTYGIVLDDLMPILLLLRENREPAEEIDATRPVPVQKMSFNGIADDLRSSLIDGMKYSPIIDRYYSETRDALERSEVARGFREEYARVKVEYDDPEDVFWRLEQYMFGNSSPNYRQRREAMALSAYFFSACHIFDEPTELWLAEHGGQPG